MAKALSQQEFNRRKAMLEKGSHWCSKCKQFRELEYFAKSKNTMFGYYNWCRDCQAKVRNGNRRILDKANRINRQIAAHYAQLGGGCCQRCGYSKSVAALDFHHINPNEKENTVNGFLAARRLDEATKEMRKCALLCSNCHREYEAGLWRCEFVRRKDGPGWTIIPGSIIETSYDDLGELPDKFLFSQLGFNL